MKTSRATVFVLALAAVAAASGYAFAQGKYREQAHDGPYRVVLSKPIVQLGFTAGTLYREHEYLGAMFNQLDKDGLVPVFTEVLNEGDQRESERLMVVCRTR